MENKNTLTPPPIKGNPLKDFINSNYLKPEPHKIGAQTAAGVNKELDRSFEVPKSQYLKGLTTFGYENMGDVQANNQSTLDVVGNATGKLLSNAFTGAAESTVGTVFGVVDALVEWDYSKLYENAFTKNVIDPINKAANEAMPIYQTEVQKNAPFFSKEYLTSGGFWGDGVVASTGYTVGSILGGWALGAATGLTKGAKIAEEVASAASKGESISNNILQQAKKLNNLDTGRQIMLGTMMGAGESAQQTRQATEALKQYYQDYNKKMIDEGHPELVYDSGEIEKLVNRSGILTYGINLALTAGTDIAQLGRFIKPTWEAEKIAKNQIIKNAQGQLVDATLEKTFLNNTVVKGLGNFAKKGAPELLQEFGQTATDVSVQNYLKKRDDKEANSTIDDIITSVIEGIVSTASSKEGLTGMFAGLLGGGAFGMMGAGKERTQKQTNTAKAIATLNTDPEFKMALQTKIGDYVRIQAFNQDEDKATDNGDKLAAKNAKSNAFIATVKSHIDSGTVENLKERVKLLQKSDDKSFEDAFGFTEAGQKVDAGQRHKITQDLIDKIENIEKMDQAIQVKYSGNFDIKTSPLKWAANRELMAQLLFSAANIDNVDEREKSLSADIYKLTGLSYQNTRGFQDENLIEDTEKAFGKANKSFVAKWGKVDGDYRAGYEKSSEYREYVQTKSEFDNAREEKELNDAYITDFAKQLEKVNPLKAVEAKNAIVDINRLKEQREKLIHLYNELNNPKTLNTIVEETKKVEDEETEESKPATNNKNDRAQDDTEDAINDRREAELEPFKQAIVDNENLTPEEEEKILESIDEINTRYDLEEAALQNSKKQQTTKPGRAKVVYNGKEVEGQLMTTPQGTTIVKYKEGNKIVNIVVTKNEDGSYSAVVPVSKKNEDTTNNTPETIVTNVVSEVVSSGLADPTNIATEETQADIIQNVKEEYEIGETIVGERVGSTQPGIVMMRQYFHNFIPKLLGNGQKFFQFFFTKGEDGLPIIDNTTGINTAVVNSPNGIKEGDKVVYKIFTTTNTKLKKSIEDNIKGISENSKGNKRGFHESIGIYTESGELVGMYPLPQNVDKSISESSKGIELEAARQENIKERLAILDKLTKGEEASTTIQIKTSGTLITKTLGGLANYTDNSGNTRSVGNNIVVREQDKVGGLSVYVVNDGSKLLLPYGYKGDREALESELGSFGNWGRKGQVFMLVKSANNTWYPVPVTSNKVTEEVADKVVESLKSTDLDSIIAAINPYVFATLSNTKKGAVLVDIQDTDASFTIKKEIFYLSDIKEGKNIAKFKEALMKLNQNIEVKNLNTKATQEEAKANETITTNAWTDLDGNYLVQPKMIVNPIREISDVQEEETDEQGNPITTLTLADINGTTDTKADIEKQKEVYKKMTKGTPINKDAPKGIKIGDKYDDRLNIISVAESLADNFDKTIADNNGLGYEVISKVTEYGEMENGVQTKAPKIEVIIFNNKADADAFFVAQKAKLDKYIADAELAALENKVVGSVSVGGDVEAKKAEIKKIQDEIDSFDNEYNSLVDIVNKEDRRLNAPKSENEIKLNELQDKINILRDKRDKIEQSLKETPQAGSVGAIEDVAKENEDYKKSREATEIVSKENPDASILITPKGNDLNLTAVYVGKEKRGQGIGSKVLESVKKQADKLGKKVVLDATNELDEETDLERLGKFYEKNGFVKVGENKFEYTPKETPQASSVGVGGDVKIEGENKDGSIYKSTTKEKDGVVITNYDAYRKEDGKKYSISGRKLKKEEFLLEYKVDEDTLDLLDGAEQIVVREVRDNKGKLGITVRLKFADGWMEADVAAVEQSLKETPKAGSSGVDTKASIEKRIVELQKRFDEDKYEKEIQDILDSLTKGVLPDGFRFVNSPGSIQKYNSKEDKWVDVNEEIISKDKDILKSIDIYFNQKGLGEKISNLNKQYREQIKPFKEKEELEDKNITDEQSKLLSTKEGILIRKDWSLGKGLGFGSGVDGITELDEVDKDGNKFEATYYLTGENDEWIDNFYFLGKTEQEVIDKINAKYNAELAALNNKGATATASENEKGKPKLKKKIESLEEDEYGDNPADKPADKPMFTAKKDFKQENTKEFKAWLKNTLPQFGLTVADFAKVKGLSSRSYGQFRNMMIYLNISAPTGTGFHEAFHGVFRNLLTEDEQVELMQEAKKKYKAPTAQELSALEQHYKKEYNINLSPEQLNDLYYEEKLADDFAEYSETYNPKSIGQKIRDFFNKILSWFGVFTQTNQSKIDTLFNSVNAGKFKTKAPLFNSKKFQPVDKKIDEENMSAYVQDMLVTNLLGQYTNSLFTKLSNGISLESTRLNYDIFNEIYQYHKGLKTENKLKPKQKDINNLILYHFDAFSDEVVKALAQRGIDTKRDFTTKEGNLVPGLDSEINASENKDSKGYGEQVRISGFNTASPRLKLFLSDIQAIDTKGNPKTFLGKPVYVDMTNLYYYLEENLVGINTYQEQIKELEKLSEFRPEIKNVIDKLQNTPSAIYSTRENQNKRRAEQIRIQNDFKTNFSKQHLGFRLVKFSTDHATGKTTFEVMGSNRQDFGREIYTEWTDALLDPNRITTTKHDTVKNKQTGAIERDIQQFGTTKAKALNVKVGKLLEKMLPTKDKNGKLVPSKHTPDIDDVTDMFRLVGIDFDEKVIQDNLTNPKLYKDFKAYTTWLASTEKEIEATISIEKLGRKGLSELVNYQVKSMYKGYTTSFNNVENKAVYAIQLPNYQSKLFDRLTGANKDAEISLLERDNFLKGNLILEDLKTEYSETGFQFTAIDGLKNTKNSKEGVKFGDMTDKDMMASNIAMFQNKAVNAAKKGTSKEKIAIIPYLIPADKSMLYYFDVISRNFNIYTDPEKGVTVDPNSASIKHFINRVKAETERMKSALKDKENFYKGALKIEDLFENYHYTGDALKSFNKIKDTLSPAEYKEAVHKLFNGRAFKFNYFLNEDREFLDKELLSLVHTELMQEGVISKETEARLKASLVKELTEEVQRTIKNVTKEGLTEDSLSIAKGKFNEVVGNYAVNRYLYNIELSVLLNGDEAFYKPGDLAKRTPQSGAFTTSNNTNPNDSFKVQVVKDVEESTPSAAILREISSEKVAAAYDKVNLTDAQLIMTPEATRKMLDARGTWTDAHEEAFKIAENITNPDKIPYKYRGLLSAQKIFVYGLVWNEKLQRYVPSQIKCSVMTAHKVLAVDNEVLRDFRERSTAEGFHVLTYKSAFKAAMPFAANVENYNGEGVISIPEEFFGFQQDNPDHLLDAENDSLRQSQMLLPALASEENRAQLLELQAANIKESTEKLGKELANPEDFNRIVQDSLTKRATTENVVKSLAMSPDGSFKIGLDTGFTSTSAENLISSLFTNNIIKQKFKGGSGVQASALGFKFKNLKEQQVAVEGNKELKTLQTSLEYKYNIDNKSLEYVECALPAWAREFFNEDGFLRSDVPDNLKELFCYRIPTEGAHSMLPLRVVKFLPEVIGNYIILPGEITKQFGADFDFDKIYFIAPEFTKDKQTGELSKIEYDYNKSVSENSREARNNRILEIYIETLQDAANLEMVMTPSGFEDLTYFKEHILKIKNPLKNYYLGTTQDGLRERNHTAAAIKGQSNLHVTGHAYATLLQLDSQTYNKQGEKTSSGTLEIDGNKQTNYSSKRSIDGKYIADELSQILAASLDDLKNPILAYLNLTKDSIDVACTFVRAGFGITRMEHLMTQPIIFELAEELKTNQEQIKKDINSKPFRAEDLLLAYQVKLNSILGNLNIDVGDYEQKQKYKGGGITVKEMIEWKKRTNFNISKTDAQANYDLAEYYQGQIKVLSQYDKAEKISNGLKELNRFFAINKEVGPNFENIIQQVDRYNIINSSEFPVKGFNISNIPALEAIYGAQLEAVDFLSRHFPYNSSLYNTIKNRVAELVTRRDKIINKELEDGVVPEARTTKSKLTPENRMLINGFTGAFISQLGNIEGVPSMFSSLTKEERERILEQVPKDLIKLAKDSTSVRNNPFIKNLKNSFDKKSNTMFSKTRGNRLDVNKKDLASDGFMDLWNNPETRPFAEDLMKYSFITTGLFNGLHSFHQLFPTDAIVESGYADFKKTVLQKLNNESYTLTRAQQALLTDQLVRNFPDAFIKNVNKEGLTSDIKKELPNQIFITITEESKKHLNSIILDTIKTDDGFDYILAKYFKVFDKVKKDFIIYREIAPNSYEQVVKLGVPGSLIEMDTNNDIKVSIITKNKVYLKNTIPETNMPEEELEAYNQRNQRSMADNSDFYGMDFETPVVDDEPVNDFLDNNNQAAQEEETQVPEPSQLSTSVTPTIDITLDKQRLLLQEMDNNMQEQMLEVGKGIKMNQNVLYRLEQKGKELEKQLKNLKEQSINKETATQSSTSVEKFSYARTANNSYEVSTAGDSRFSALNAKLKDGRTIEEAYQLDIKGYRKYKPGEKVDARTAGEFTSEDKNGKEIILDSSKATIVKEDTQDPSSVYINIEGEEYSVSKREIIPINPSDKNWKNGKGKKPLHGYSEEDNYLFYKDLWSQWAKENPSLLEDLRQKAQGKVLTDKFASSPVSQARALADILNETTPSTQPSTSVKEKPINPRQITKETKDDFTCE